MAKTQQDYVSEGTTLFAKSKPCPAERASWQSQATRKGWLDARDAVPPVMLAAPPSEVTIEIPAYVSRRLAHAKAMVELTRR